MSGRFNDVGLTIRRNERPGGSVEKSFSLLLEGVDRTHETFEHFTGRPLHASPDGNVRFDFSEGDLRELQEQAFDQVFQRVQDTGQDLSREELARLLYLMGTGGNSDPARSRSSSTSPCRPRERATACARSPRTTRRATCPARRSPRSAARWQRDAFERGRRRGSAPRATRGRSWSRPMRWLATLSLLAVFAPAGSAASANTCDDRVDRLEKWLASASWEPSVLVGKVKVLELSRGIARSSRQVTPAPQIIVTPDAIALDGRPVWLAGQPLAPVGRALGDLLAATRKTSEQRFESVLVAAAGDARWEQMVATADGITRAGLAADLAFEVPRELPAPPPASPLGREMEKARRDPVALSRFNKQVFAPCAGAPAVFAQLAGQPDKLRFLVAGVPAALRRCGCATAPEDAMTWFWHLLIDDGPPGLRVIRVVPGDAGARAVTASPAARWSETHARLVAASARPVRLIAR